MKLKMRSRNEVEQVLGYIRPPLRLPWSLSIKSGNGVCDYLS